MHSAPSSDVSVDDLLSQASDDDDDTVVRYEEAAAALLRDRGELRPRPPRPPLAITPTARPAPPPPGDCMSDASTSADDVEAPPGTARPPTPTRRRGQGGGGARPPVHGERRRVERRAGDAVPPTPPPGRAPPPQPVPRRFFSGGGRVEAPRRPAPAPRRGAPPADRRGRTPVQRAEHYERRLLRPPSHADLVSPLQVKRRMKPRVELDTRSRRRAAAEAAAQGDGVTGGTAAKAVRDGAVTTNGQRFNLAGVVTAQPLRAISRQLERNAHDPGGAGQVSAAGRAKSPPPSGPGLPTCLAVNSKFIAVGTQRGLVLVFDHFQEVRQVLGRADPRPGLPPPPPANGAVTSVDVSASGDFLAAGFASGAVTLWDVIRGTVLKSVAADTGGIGRAVSSSPVTCIRFYREKEAAVIVVDGSGLVSRMTFFKMIWNTYAVETECLLDGSAGRVPTLHVLPPVGTRKRGGGGGAAPPTDAGAPADDCQNHPCRTILLLALSSERSSFVVAVEPSIRVLHKWPKPGDDGSGDGKGKVKVKAKGNEPPPPSAPTPPQHTTLPTLAWGWGLCQGGGQRTTPILARGWGTTVQLLQAKFPPGPSGSGAAPDAAAEVPWPAFGAGEEFDAPAPVVAIEWLGERSLVYLTLTNELTVADTVMMTLLERLDLSGTALVYSEFELARQAGASAARRAPSFQNSIRTSDGRLLILAQSSVVAVTALSWDQRIGALIENGEWLEALAFALDHYESTVRSLEDRQRQQGADAALASHPEFNARRRSPVEEQISDLLLRYLRLAVENAPPPPSSPAGGRTKSAAVRGANLARSHFQMLAGVCIEFCISIRRLDLLFGEVFRCFQSVQYTAVFLDVLEPYVLHDKLRYVAPAAMAEFVSHCKAAGDVSVVERCLLHMDVTIMDFDSILALLRKNDMYSALLHVYAAGLNDFITPLGILLEGVFDAAEECDVYGAEEDDHDGQQPAGGGIAVGPPPPNAFQRLGYKCLLYVRYSLAGRRFPQGTPLPEGTASSLRPELLRFLLRSRYSPADGARVASTRRSVGHRADDYPYLRLLVLVDTGATLDALSSAFDAPDARFASSTYEAGDAVGRVVEVDADAGSVAGSVATRGGAAAPPPTLDGADSKDDAASAEEPAGRRDAAPSDGGRQRGKEFGDRELCPDRQLFVGVLSSIIMPDALIRPGQLGAFHDFIAKYLLAGAVRAPPDLTHAIIFRMCGLAGQTKTDGGSRGRARRTGGNHKLAVTVLPLPLSREGRAAQSAILDLLKAIPSNSYDRDEVLPIVERAGLFRAALVLHKARGGFSVPSRAEQVRHFVRAIECYLDDEEDSFRKEVFPYVRAECSHAMVTSGGATTKDEDDHDWDQKDDNDDDGDGDNLKSALWRKLPGLIELDAIATVQLVAELFVSEFDTILRSLAQNEKRQFEFLRTIISGNLTDADPMTGQVMNTALRIDHHQLYLNLMAKFTPEAVYHHLSTVDNYQPEEALRLCQQYEIADASAYLLERMGNVSGALQLMLKTLEERLMGLKSFIRRSAILKKGQSTRGRSTEGTKDDSRHGDDAYSQLSREKEIQSVRKILIVSLDLCERNSSGASAVKVGIGDDGGINQTTATHYGSQLWFSVLDRLINAKGFLRLGKELPQHSSVVVGVLDGLLQVTMQRMVHQVPLPDLLRKITSDHSGNNLGEIRKMITSMLETYGFELELCGRALGVARQDERQMALEKKHLTVKGIPVDPMRLSTFEQGGKMIVGRSVTNRVLVNRKEDIYVDAFERKPSSDDFSKENSNILGEERRMRGKILRQNRPSLRSSNLMKLAAGRDDIIANGTDTADSLRSSVSFRRPAIGVLTEAQYLGSLG